MTFHELFRRLTDAFGNTPYASLELYWNPYTFTWSAHVGYWGVRDQSRLKGPKDWSPGTPVPAEKPIGKTPEEAVRRLAKYLRGKQMYRTGQNGSWGIYDIDEEITLDGIAFTAPVEPLPLSDGHNEVSRDKAIDLAMKADKVFSKTYIGDRPLKGFPDEHMVPEDRDGKGFERLLQHLRDSDQNSTIEIGYYDHGQTVGFRGGIL